MRSLGRSFCNLVALSAPGTEEVQVEVVVVGVGGILICLALLVLQIRIKPFIIKKCFRMGVS